MRLDEECKSNKGHLKCFKCNTLKCYLMIKMKWIQVKVETSNVRVELNPFLAPTGTPKKKVVLQPRQLWEKPGKAAAIAPSFSDPGMGVVHPGVPPSVNTLPTVYDMVGERGPVVPKPGHGGNLNPV